MRVVLLGEGECMVTHGGSGQRVRTSMPKAFGGSGSSFSSTDLLAAALGSCIATDLERLARRHGIDPREVRVEVEKTLALKPKRIEALHLSVRLPVAVAHSVVLPFQRSAEHCLVRRSLARTIPVRVTVGGG